MIRGLAALVVAASMLASCSGGGDGDGRTTVTFWQFWPETTIQPLIDDFEAQNPDLQVELQQLTWASGLEKITAAVAAGNPPDLVELGSTWFGKFAGNGALRDLTGDAASIRERFLMWEACTYQGRVYAYPWLTGTRALFYNRALAREAGIDPHHPPATWDDLLAWAKALHRPDRLQYGYGLNSGERYVQFKKFMPFAWGNGGSVLTADNRECAFNTAAVGEALDFYLTLKPHALLEKQEILDQAFKDGRLGLMISGAWLLRTIPRDAPDLDFGVALVPRPGADHGTHASFGGGELLAVMAKARQPQAAQRLARFLMDPPQALAVSHAEVSVLPAARGVDRDSVMRRDPRRMVFLKQLEHAVFPPNHRQWVEIEDVVDKWVERALFGADPADEALDQACREINALLQ